MPEMSFDELKPFLDCAAGGRIPPDDEMVDRTFTDLGCDEPAVRRHACRAAASRYGTRMAESDLAPADTPGQLLDIVNSFLTPM